jgi:hypothetical protein
MCRVLQDGFSQRRTIIRPLRAGEIIQPGRTAEARTVDSEATAAVRPTADRMADLTEAAAIIRRRHRMAPALMADTAAVHLHIAALVATTAEAALTAALAEVRTVEVIPDANA